jgi:DNA-binding NtrC family response regulator
MSPALEAARKPLRVLIVEDEPRLRDLLFDTIPEMGFTAAAVRTAEDGLRVMRADPHDIMLLDLQLPGMGGMDLFERVRADWPTTQVIVLTGFGNLESAQRAIHLDVVEFLSKPCHLRDIEVALDRARRRAAATAQPATEPASPTDAVTLADVEYQQILTTLRRHQGNRTAAASELGISRRTLHYKLALYRSQGLSID